MQAPDNGGSVQGMMETMKALIEEATKKLEDKMDDVTSEIKAMVGDLDERLDMVECYVNEQRTKKAHDRSGAMKRGGGGGGGGGGGEEAEEGRRGGGGGGASSRTAKEEKKRNSSREREEDNQTFSYSLISICGWSGK
ncbi:unnamed protein product [Microthlaspi erraticum]|uniref:Uncharacterized protein n=1 Tax=Microthlaspi erraticum TaxID=1685480 RepID=A0A6D2KYJ8_9BRAS|nr:unnamed protein product [Microthlaspi erraticum]